eukprot:jgi/Astpho2/3373/e_gw1.00054.11.1_t
MKGQAAIPQAGGHPFLLVSAGTPFWKLVVKQFDDLLVKILIVAAVVDFGIAVINGERGASVFVEPGVIVLILAANATVGVITETNAEKAIEELKAYEAQVATVLRNGRLQVLPAAELVPGDIVEVSVGAQVPADLRVTEIASTVLRADQSVLTGESGSVEKHLEPTAGPKAVYQDKTCILFSGTVITAGRARAIVTGTGPATAIGKIRDAIADTIEEMTPLKRKLDEFGTLLSKGIAVVCVLVWVINIGHFKDPVHGGWVQGALYYFKIAVALAVAAIPEGLPAVVTTCLALGTRRMAKHHAIVRSLPSVETLGCTTVICSDKTGTLTTNQMAVAKVAVPEAPMGLDDPVMLTLLAAGNTFAPEGEIFEQLGSTLQHPADQPSLLSMAQCAALCNDSSLQYAAEKDAYVRIGEATEVALRVLVEKIGPRGYGPMPTALEHMTKQERVLHCNHLWEAELHKVCTQEFTRDRKMMSVLCASAAGATMFVKGAPEAVLAACTMVQMNTKAEVVPLTDKLQSNATELMEVWGGQRGLRCLALACKRMPVSTTQIKVSDETGLTFLGLVGMHDPPRLEVADALATCRAAGIRVIVVTGDTSATARAICGQVGALDRFDAHEQPLSVLTGLEFDALSPVEQANAVAQMAVFARVEPSHKRRLVELLKAQASQCLAMTGDGVNDAPALKKADIGVAMGSGTAVAKHAADMVLSDDNFATIVAAVAEGRAIFNNTKQFIRYMVSSNIGEVAAIFSAALLGMPEVLNPVQLLWVNLVTDGLPATALGFNAPDRDIMRTKPRKQTDSIVNRWLAVRYLVIGLYVGVATVAGSVWWHLYYQGGPRLTWRQLTSFQSCSTAPGAELPCQVFRDRHPSTISMTVLVIVEMFNSLNALSENNSLLQLPPWSNLWLLAAIAVSVLLHLVILYVPPVAALFTVTVLTRQEWAAVLWLSFPVILVDEVLKLLTRLSHPTGNLARCMSRDVLMPVHRLMPRSDSTEHHRH